MFKKFTPFKIGARGATATREAFVPCGATQEFSIGFIPHANGESLVHGVELLMLETKTVPAEIIKRRANAVADRVQQETGRRPKGNALANIKADVRLELLPTAFSKRKKIELLWLEDLLLVGSTSSNELDLITNLLVGKEAGLTIENLPVDGGGELGGALTTWAREPDSAPFGVGLALTVCTDGEGVATFKKTNVRDPEVRAALEPGAAVVTKLDLATDDGAAFTLSDELRFTGVKLPIPEGGGDHADAVSADCFLARAGLRALTNQVREALSHAV